MNNLSYPVRKFYIVLCLLALAGSSLACSLTSLLSGYYSEPEWEHAGPGEPFPPEEPWMMEEHPPEEPWMHEEPHPEEPWMHEEPQPEEPWMHEEHPPEPMPQQPPQQPAPQQPAAPQPPSGGSSKAWSTDLAVTDIYPGKLPYGQFWFRITNHGPKTASNVQVPVICRSLITNYFNGSKSTDGPVTITINANLKPGETKAYNTNLTTDTKNFWYNVTCEVNPNFNDPNPGNNSYSEIIPPPP